MEWRSPLPIALLAGGCTAFVPTLPCFNRAREAPALFLPSASKLNDFVDPTTEDSNRVTTELLTAGDNFCRVTGADPLEIKALLTSLERESYQPRLLQECADTLLQWQSITRGADLFISHMGGFDIEKAYKMLIGPMQGAWMRRSQSITTFLDYGAFDSNDTALDALNATARQLFLDAALDDPSQVPALLDCMSQADKENGILHYVTPKEQTLKYRVGAMADIRGHSRPYWLLSPVDLQLKGYFDPSPRGYMIQIRWQLCMRFLFSQPEDYPQRRYITKYYQDYFKHHQYWGFLDELIRCGSDRPEWFEPDDADTTAIYQQAWPLGLSADDMPPPHELHGRLRRLRQEQYEAEKLEDDVTYDHLNGLKDKQIGKLRLLVLRSKQAVAQVGNEMLNCAFDYERSVRGGSAILVKATNVKNTYPLALGMYDLSQGQWTQIYGPRNERVEDWTRACYEGYSQDILEWNAERELNFFKQV